MFLFGNLLSVLAWFSVYIPLMNIACTVHLPQCVMAPRGCAVGLDII